MRDALATVADVIVLAPETEQSASSHALSPPSTPTAAQR